MNRIKKAIIMAAGIGSRMQPVTLSIPKPLVKVNGIRMIDTVIEALHYNKIYDVYIVVGYMKEQFKVLQDKYDNITLIENPYYDTCNNISSLYVAREYIGDTIILDGDQIIYNKEILQSEYDKSGYSCILQEEYTDEWLLELEDNIIKSCSRTGGSNGWRLYSVSRWTKEDGQRLKKHLELEFEKNKNRQIYWDDVALFCYPEEYQLRGYKINKGDIVEIDNIEELAQIDKSYGRYVR